MLSDKRIPRVIISTALFAMVAVFLYACDNRPSNNTPVQLDTNQVDTVWIAEEGIDSTKGILVESDSTDS